MSIHPDVNVAGQAEETIRFYQKVLGEARPEITRDASMPQDKDFTRG